MTRSASRADRPHRVGEVGARARGCPGARRRRDRVDRFDAGVPRARHRHRQAHRVPSAPRCRTTSSTSPIPTRSGRSPASRPRPAPPSPTSSAGASARCSSAGPASTCRRWSIRSPSRPKTARCGRSSKPAPPRPTASPRPTTSSRGVDPVAAARMEPGNRRRITRALEVIAHHRAPVLVVRAGAPGVRARRCSRSAWPASGCPAACSASRIARPVRGDARRRSGRRGRRPTRPRAAVPRPPARRSGTRRCWPTSRARSPSLDAALDAAVGPHPGVRPSPTHVVPPRPAHRLVRRRRESLLDPARACWQAGTMTTVRLSKLHATGNDFLVWSWLGETEVARDPGASGRPRSATATAAWAPTASSS